MSNITETASARTTKFLYSYTFLSIASRAKFRYGDERALDSTVSAVLLVTFTFHLTCVISENRIIHYVNNKKRQILWNGFAKLSKLTVRNPSIETTRNCRVTEIIQSNFVIVLMIRLPEKARQCTQRKYFCGEKPIV